MWNSNFQNNIYLFSFGWAVYFQNMFENMKTTD